MSKIVKSNSAVTLQPCPSGHIKVWIDDTVVYHSKIEQKATLSSMNKLSEIALRPQKNGRFIRVKH